MSFIEGFEVDFLLEGFASMKGRTDSLLQILSESMAVTSCSRADSMNCDDDSNVLVLKMIAFGAILVAGVSGVAIPLVGKDRRLLRTDGNLFFAAKAFAAGVILATGFVHMLPDGSAALTDSCLPKKPWSKFSFSGFIAMMAALLTLVADFVGTQFYERKEEKRRAESLVESVPIVPVNDHDGMANKEENGDGMHIVGIHVHAAQHSHNHPEGNNGCESHVPEHSHGDHSHGLADDNGEEGVRHVVVSQILELGIVSHSVIIGLSLGVSHSPCTIRPLIAALSLHQFFEGFALGGCISQAQFQKSSTILMACFFAITTPAGIGIGTALSSLYNNNSPRALIVEGILDSISAGILVYMSLVDLIAADFMSKRMRCNARLQVVSYFALFLGASLMSSLAIWS